MTMNVYFLYGNGKNEKPYNYKFGNLESDFFTQTKKKFNKLLA